MDGATIAVTISGFFVVLISAGSFGFVIHRNGMEKAHLSGRYEQKVTDLIGNFNEFKAEVREDISRLSEDVKHCVEAVDGRKR